MDSINKIYSLHLKDTLTASNQLRQLKVNMMLEVVRNDDGSYKSKFPFTLSEEYSSTGMLKSRTIGFFNPSELSVEPKSLTVKEFEFKRFFYFDNGKVSSQLNMNTDFYLTEFSIVNYQKLHLNGTTDFEAKYNQNDWTEYIEYDPNRPEIKKCILDFKKSEFYGSYDSVLIQKKLKTILADEFRFIQEQHKCIINGHISNSNEIESLFGEDTSIYTFVEIDAEYPGGYPAMMKYIYHDHLIYPPSAIELGIQGKVALKFVVEKNGQLSNISLVRGIPGCTECDKEAQRVVSNMPNWKPAKNNGIIVRQWIFLPIRFLLKKF
jgi:TonB family protein